ncbi:unnamed protein product, partial [Amoebophrya sp. A25]
FNQQTECWVWRAMFRVAPGSESLVLTKTLTPEYYVGAASSASTCSSASGKELRPVAEFSASMLDFNSEQRKRLPDVSAQPPALQGISIASSAGVAARISLREKLEEERHQHSLQRATFLNRLPYRGEVEKLFPIAGTGAPAWVGVALQNTLYMEYLSGRIVKKADGAKH